MSASASEIIKGELEFLEKVDGVIFTPTIVNWLSVFVVVEENALYVYPSETSLNPIHVIRVESMYVENISNDETGRDFCFMISNAFAVNLFSAKNKALQKLWVEKLVQLRLLRQHVLIMESQKLIESHESSVVKLSGYVYFHENSRKSKWGRRFLELKGLNLCVYDDTNTGRKIERRMNLTCAIVSMSSIDSKINLSKSPKKIRNKDKWPTKYFIHVKVSDSGTSQPTKESGNNISNDVTHAGRVEMKDIFICTFTKEEKKAWETAFRVAGRGGMAPLAGCNITANITKYNVIENDKHDKHVVYEIIVTTRRALNNGEHNDNCDSTRDKNGNDADDGSNDGDNNSNIHDKIKSNTELFKKDSDGIDIGSFNYVPPATWTITRRYSEFLKLHQMLTPYFAVFNRIDIPKFPSKTYHRRRSFVYSHIDERLGNLTTYLNAILEFKSIRENGVLHRFLLDSNDAISTFLTCRLDADWHLKNDNIHVVDNVKDKMKKDIIRVRAASIYRNVQADDIVEINNNIEHKKHTRKYSRNISIDKQKMKLNIFDDDDDTVTPPIIGTNYSNDDDEAYIDNEDNGKCILA
jgi:hypothetical protein